MWTPAGLPTNLLLLVMVEREQPAPGDPADDHTLPPPSTGPDDPEAPVAHPGPPAAE